MVYADKKIGKITKWNKSIGTGEITTEDKIYIFTANCLKDTTLKEGDLVQFRAEKAQIEDKAFFIKKYSENEELPRKKIAHSKLYNPEEKEV